MWPAHLKSINLESSYRGKKNKNKVKEEEPSEEPFDEVFSKNEELRNVSSVSCKSHVKLCIASKKKLKLCKDVTHAWHAFGQSTHLSFEDYKDACRLSQQCLNNVHRFFELVLDTGLGFGLNEYDIHLRFIKLINACLKYGCIAGGFMTKFIGSFLLKQNSTEPVHNSGGTDQNPKALNMFTDEELEDILLNSRYFKNTRTDIDVYMTPENFTEFAQEFQSLFPVSDTDLLQNPNTTAYENHPSHNGHVRSDFSNFYSNYPPSTPNLEKCMTQVKFIYSGLADNPQNIKFHYAIRNVILPIDIVVTQDIDEAIRNFDLTCCMISLRHKKGTDSSMSEEDSFLAKNALQVDIMNPTSILHRNCTMTAPFVQEFLNGNTTTRNRVMKYSKKWNISIPIPILKNSDKTESGELINESAKGTFHLHLKYLNYNRLRMNRDALTPAMKALRHLIYLYTYESDWLVDVRVVAAYNEEKEAIIPFLNLLETQVKYSAFEHTEIRRVFDEKKSIILSEM